MKRRIAFMFAVIALLFAVGCAGVPQAIHMSRLADVKAGKSTLQADTFGTGDIPAVVVTGCGGHNVVIRIVDLATGSVVKTYKDYVPEDWIRWWWFNDLPGGSYRAELYIEGERTATVQFLINRQSP